MTEVKIFGAHDERTKEQMARCMQYGSAVGGVLCADGHLGYAQPVGGVIAYDEHISVSGVGFDIACGNMAVKLDVPKTAIDDRVGRILEKIATNVSFGLGRSNAEKVEHELFDSPLWQEAEVVEKMLARRAYDDFLHRRQDPALLEKAPGNEFTARVFPIPPNADKHIIISYSQELRDAPYVLPLRGLPAPSFKS